MSKKFLDDTGVSDLVNSIATNIANKYATKAIATQSANGLMSAADKKKLDGIATGANKTVVDSALSSTSTNPVQNKVINSALAGKAASSHTHSSYVNQNAFSNITVGSTTVSADSATDTLTLVAGSNITITPDATNDKITIASTNTWRGIQNNLTSNSTTDSLSAAQGKVLKGLVDGKAASSHTHTKSQITDFPSSLPANGGNADTVDGLHAWTHAVLNSDGYFDGNDYICFTDNAYGDGRYNVWTPSGKGVRVDYATDADKLDGLHASNFVNYTGRNFDQVNDPAYRVPYECIINSSDVKNTGLPDAKYWHIKYFMHSDSNGYGCQLAFPLNGSDYRPRYRTSFEMTWDEWKEIVTLSDIPTTLMGALIAQSNTAYTTPQVRNVTMSTSAPSGGYSGQIHFQYS